MARDKDLQKGTQTKPVTSTSWAQKLQTATGKPIQVKEKPERAPSAILLIDCSLSMGDNDKLEQAKQGARAFAKEAIGNGYHVGLVSFSGSPSKLCDPTTNLGVVEQGLGGIRLESATAIGKALNAGIEVLQNNNGIRVLTLVTDGYPTDEVDHSYRAADLAKSKGIEIMTIGTDDADLAFLQRLATRNELAKHVDNKLLGSSLAKLAGLLPPPARNG